MFRKYLDKVNQVDQEDMRERLSFVQHEIWSHWTKWQFGTCGMNPDGSITIPAKLVQRWEKQAQTAYTELTEKEKDSDREQTDKILECLEKNGWKIQKKI